MATLAWASFGFLLQEVLHWYELRGKLHEDEFITQIKSPGHWIVTAIVFVVVGVAAYAWFQGREEPPSPRDLILFGAAFPALFKKAVAAPRTQRRRRLGRELGAGDAVDRYLGIRK